MKRSRLFPREFACAWVAFAVVSRKSRLDQFEWARVELSVLVGHTLATKKRDEYLLDSITTIVLILIHDFEDRLLEAFFERRKSILTD